jgi:hypothetical protein
MKPQPGFNQQKVKIREKLGQMHKEMYWLSKQKKLEKRNKAFG